MNIRGLIVGVCVFLGNLIQLFAQQENVWVFGGMDLVGAGVNFNSTPVTFKSGIEGWGEANASVADKDGQLLFFTEGSKVWDKTGAIMPNGNNLTGIITRTSYTATTSTVQGAVIVPMPGNAHHYYVFSLVSSEIEGKAGYLYYSVIDMQSNNGLGDVISAKKGVLIDSLLTEKMATVVGENCNIWLMLNTQDGYFKSFEITENGLSQTPVLSDGGEMGTKTKMLGTIVFSANRKKMAVTQLSEGSSVGLANGCALFDFDAATGKASNSLQLLRFSGAYGAAISPDDTKLYITTANPVSLLQFDLNKNNRDSIALSSVRIGSDGFATARLAPDNKIYVAKSGLGASRLEPLDSLQWLGVINQPNLLGTACNYQAAGLELFSGTRVHLGLPTHVPPLLKKDTFLTKHYDTAGCFVTQMNVSAKHSGGHSFVWNDGSLGAAKTVTQSGKYWVSYASAPCNFHTDTFEVWIPNVSLPVIVAPDTLCKGWTNGMVWIQKNEQAAVSYIYRWLNSNGDTLGFTDTLKNVTAGNYLLSVQVGACDTLLSFPISELSAKVAFSTSDTIVCLDDSIVLENNSEYDFYSFLWSIDQGKIYEQYNEKLYTVQFKESGTIEVVLIGKGNYCTDTFIRKIIVDEPISKADYLKSTSAICVGESVDFKAEVVGQVNNYSWDFGDLNVFETKSLKTRHAYNQPGQYAVSLRANARVCADVMHTDIINVHVLPQVFLGNDGELCMHGNALRLANQFQNIENSRYLWSTGDTLAEIDAVYPGNYVLTIRTEPGCTASSSIEIEKGCYIDIPNAFSPNGDGVNDCFFPRWIKAQNISNFKIEVFNRWGQQLFFSNQLHGQGWDGRWNGELQPLGVYIYRIEVGFQNGYVEVYESNFTLIK